MLAMAPSQTDTMTLPTINSTPPSSSLPSTTVPSGTATPNPLLGRQQGQLLPPAFMRSLSPIRSREDARAGRGGRDGASGGGKWSRLALGRGMIDDVKRRAPYYARDWLDAWDYRVVPATLYMYFAK